MIKEEVVDMYTIQNTVFRKLAPFKSKTITTHNVELSKNLRVWWAKYILFTAWKKTFFEYKMQAGRARTQKSINQSDHLLGM